MCLELTRSGTRTRRGRHGGPVAQLARAQRDCLCPLSPRAEPWEHLQRLFERLKTRSPNLWDAAYFGYAIRDAIGVEYPATRYPRMHIDLERERPF